MLWLGSSNHGSIQTPSGAQGAYKVKNLAWTTYGVYTNKVPVGPYRGYGQHASPYVVERVMDLVALELNMDPVEVRRKNFISAHEFPYRTPNGRTYDSGDYEATFSKVLQLAEYEALRRKQQRLRAEGILMGIGISTTVGSGTFASRSLVIGGSAIC